MYLLFVRGPLIDSHRQVMDSVTLCENFVWKLSVDKKL
jgi:hypothetical protein